MEPPDWTPDGPDDIAAVARHAMEISADRAREVLEKLGVHTEVTLFAVQVNYDGIGPMVVALTHPSVEEDPKAAESIATIAERVWQIYSGEDGTAL